MKGTHLMTTVDFITELFCKIYDELGRVCVIFLERGERGGKVDVVDCGWQTRDKNRGRKGE